MSDADFQVKGSISLELDAQGLADIKAQAAAAAQRALSVGPATSGSALPRTSPTPNQPNTLGRIVSGIRNAASNALSSIAVPPGLASVITKALPAIGAAAVALGAVGVAALGVRAAFSAAESAVRRNITTPGAEFSGALVAAGVREQIAAIQRAQVRGSIVGGVLAQAQPGLIRARAAADRAGAEFDIVLIRLGQLLAPLIEAASVLKGQIARSIAELLEALIKILGIQQAQPTASPSGISTADILRSLGGF